MWARMPVLVAVLVVTVLLPVGIHSVIATPAPSAGLAPPTAASSVVAWSSGWVSIARGACSVFNHNLGGDPDDYVVESWFLDTDDGWGINRRYYGGLEVGGEWGGVYWQKLTANTIEVCRHDNDDAADWTHIRIWIPVTTLDYDSGWGNINPGQTLTFTHGLGITATELTVGLWFSGTARGVHHYGYGGLAVDGAHQMQGAHWHDLTDGAIQVTRHPQDTDVEQVRVIVLRGAPPDYDSLVVLGGRQPIAAGATYTFTHGLNWNPNMLLVRGECYSSTLGGINQWFAGGNHDGLSGGQWQGMNLQNLTSTTVEAFRWPQDRTCPQVRVRVWKRDVQAHLPSVSLTLLSPPAGLELPVGQAMEVSCRLEGEAPATVEFLVNGVPVRTEVVPPDGEATFSWMPTHVGSQTLTVVVRMGGKSASAATRQVLAVPPGSPVRIR